MKRWLPSLLPIAWTILFLVPSAYAAAYLVAGVYEVPLEDATFQFERQWAALLFAAPLLLLVAHYVHRQQRPRLQVSRGRTLARLRPACFARARRWTSRRGSRARRRARRPRRSTRR